MRVQTWVAIFNRDTNWICRYVDKTGDGREEKESKLVSGTQTNDESFEGGRDDPYKGLPDDRQACRINAGGCKVAEDT
ncbi:unnamed protein product [Somion occarium]|uniref:Uncharacterized protein n=1 Tax=Somion occarium TaxID=3059160 RepID=A0ABP1E5P5_9APHY